MSPDGNNGGMVILGIVLLLLGLLFVHSALLWIIGLVLIIVGLAGNYRARSSGGSLWY